MNFPIFYEDENKEIFPKDRHILFLKNTIGLEEEEAFGKYGFEWHKDILKDGVEVAVRTKYKSNTEYVTGLVNQIFNEKDIYIRKALQKEIQAYILNKEEGVLEEEE